MATGKTQAIIFPFDAFGSAGSGEGAKLLADALHEMLDDARRETIPTRARAYQNRLRIQEAEFDTLDDWQAWRERGRAMLREAFDRGDFVLWLAGNHLGVLPVYDELGPDTSIIQFDAHLDVYHLHDCTSTLSHGNFLLHPSAPHAPIHQVGHRDLFLAADYRAQHFTQCFAAEEIHRDADAVISALPREGRCWIDIDCDVFDPAYFPAVGQRQPFGLSPAVVLRILEAIWNPAVRGVSLSEFQPNRDREDQSLATLVWLLEWVLLKRYERKGK